MNPQALLFIIVALACPIGMGLMMWMMSKNMRGHHDQGMAGHISGAQRLDALREQRRRLEQEIAETEKVAALEARKESLARTDTTQAGDQQPQLAEAIHR